MQVLDPVVALFRDLRRADDAIQVAMEDLFRRYYGFLKGAPRHGTRGLRLRRHRDPDGRVRAIVWSRRIKGIKTVAGRAVRFSRELPGPFQSDWVYGIAKDWTNRQGYFDFEAERRALVGARQAVVKALRALRLGLLYKWAPKAAPDDLSRADRIVSQHAPALSGRDVHPIAGAFVLAREVRRLEEDLGRVVDEYRTAFRNRLDVTFEPILTVRPNGRFRLSWGFPQTLHTPDGARRITEHIPGRPTDLWMRNHGLPARTRKEVAVFIQRLLPLERRYTKITAFLGRYRRRVHELTARVARLSPMAPGPQVHIPA